MTNDDDATIIVLNDGRCPPCLPRADRDPCGFAGSMALANESEIESNRGTICRQPSLCRRRIDQRERSFLTGSFGWVVLLTVIYLQRSEKRPGKAALLEEVINLLTLSLFLCTRESEATTVTNKTQPKKSRVLHNGR